MNRWICLIVAAAFLAGGLISITSAQPDDVIKIENKYAKRLKTPVSFLHKKHADAITCTECHHKWKKEEKKTPQKCAECHKAEDKGKLGLKRSYHTNCMGCHKAAKAQGKKAGPTTKCNDCHPKK